MLNLDFYNSLLDSSLVFGKRFEITDDLSIIPIYKSKVSVMNLKSTVKTTDSDGMFSSLDILPLGFLKVFKDDITIIDFNKKKNNIIDIPKVFSNIDVNDLLKNIKL